ncbi:hypothetical protein KFK09_005444 [Dendrobium nobile]|uniref:Uncharacterized protein n=1 Tax=Dendrobium nobile TaxID=94219 RepID=A0A8T3BVS9_DENNO|nr:hypothetical protein KFK09_005444 [Dendrobium nobile]
MESVKVDYCIIFVLLAVGLCFLLHHQILVEGRVSLQGNGHLQTRNQRMVRNEMTPSSWWTKDYAGSSPLTPKLHPSDTGVLLGQQQTSDFYPTRTSTDYRTFAGLLSKDGFISIVGLLPDAVLLTFVVRQQFF